MLVFCGENSIHQKRMDVLFLCNFSDVLIHSKNRNNDDKMKKYIKKMERK
jgi:hypothetical protein